MTQNELVKKLFYYLDMTEETDSGREFHPIIISCCRALLSKDLDETLYQLKQSIQEERNE